MHHLSTLLGLTLLILPSLATLLTATIQYQPLTPSATPLPLAVLSYDPTLPATSASTVSKFTPPKLAASQPFRIGLLAPGSLLGPSALGSATLATLPSKDDSELGPGLFRLHLGATGEITSVSYHAARPRGMGGALEKVAGLPLVEIVVPAAAPTPRLNAPVVLNPEGKVAEEVPEKSLLMKYWWVGAALLMMVMMGGGGDK